MIATLMAIHSGCDILLLDEHTSALDPAMQSRLMDYTATQVKQYHLTTVMITHSLNDAIRYGNRLIMLHQGQIVLDLQGPEKEKLTVKDLLSLFRHDEDQLLTSRGSHDS